MILLCFSSTSVFKELEFCLCPYLKMMEVNNKNLAELYWWVLALKVTVWSEFLSCFVVAARDKVM